MRFTSESLYSFIKRLRLEKAIFLLRSNRKLTILLSKDTKWFVVNHDYSELTAQEKLRLSVCMSIKEKVTYEGASMHNLKNISVRIPKEK